MCLSFPRGFRTLARPWNRVCHPRISDTGNDRFRLHGAGRILCNHFIPSIVFSPHHSRHNSMYLNSSARRIKYLTINQDFVTFLRMKLKEFGAPCHRGSRRSKLGDGRKRCDTSVTEPLSSAKPSDRPLVDVSCGASSRHIPTMSPPGNPSSFTI